MVKNVVKVVVYITLCIIAIGTHAQDYPEHETEKLYRYAMEALLDNDHETAFNTLESLLEKYPQFRLAHITYADLLASSAHQDSILSQPDALNKTRIIGLQKEAIARLTYSPPMPNLLPANILRISMRHRYVLLLDASNTRLYIFENQDGIPKLVLNYYVSIGSKGMGKKQEYDKKTPLGVYTLTSFLENNKLPELYGNGAYPLNYPNNWDKLLGHSGYGIWLHGIPGTIGTRPPQDSRGCLILSNQLLDNLSTYITPGETPILLVENLEWIQRKTWNTLRQTMSDTISQWREDWESMKLEQYLAYYAEDYRSENKNYREMVQQVRHNAKRKTYIRVTIDNIDLFLYPQINPDKEPLIVATFKQNYESNNYNTDYLKQQFWQHKDNGWKIVYAGRAFTP